MRSKGAVHLPADAAVAGIGEPRDCVCKLRWDLGRDRHQVFPVCRVYFAHALLFGYQVVKRPDGQHLDRWTNVGDDRRMSRFRRAVEIVLVFIAFPIALAGFVAVAVGVGLGLAIYVGALLAAWLLAAFVLPMVTGVMAPSEVLAGIREQRRHKTHHEGELLPDWQDVRLDIRKKPPVAAVVADD
jgi:hypothetical protein